MNEDPVMLLKCFVREHSENAFRQLVRQHSPLVYGSALRMLGGDRAAAQDVMQEVFTLLAHKAGDLDGSQLPGWLYRQACRRASNHQRAETRRKKREVAAVQALGDSRSAGDDHVISAEVEEALLALPAADRNVLILRFFEDRDFRSVGSFLATTEEAARKRVNRALERLAVLLKRKGIAVASASLGGTMTGLGKTMVSETVVSQVSVTAFKSLSAGGSASLLPLLQFFVAGVALSSLVAVSAQAVQRSSATERGTVASSLPGSAATKAKRSDNLAPLPAASSLEAVITEIRRVNSGPGNVLTSLRLEAVLDRLTNGQIPEFIALANEQLNESERAVSYTRLLERWAKADPEAALTFTAEQNVGAHVDPQTGTRLLINLFNTWARNNGAAAGAWLTTHWTLPALDEPTFNGSMKASMSMAVAQEAFLRGGKAGLLSFIRGLPTPADQSLALQPFTGASPYHRGTLLRVGPEKLLECHEALKEIEDEGVRRAALTGLWRMLGEERSGEIAALQASLDASDRFQVALGQMGITRRVSSEVPLAGGNMLRKSEPVEDRAALEQSAMDAGIAAGIPREKILQGIGEVMIGTLRGPELMAWLDRHQGEMDVDAALAAAARKSGSSNGTIGGERDEWIGINYARRISDPELRLRLCRGAYRRMVDHDRSAALACLNRPDLPADLRAEFSAIIGHTP